jgi:ELWxxDGT repeat protein
MLRSGLLALSLVCLVSVPLAAQPSLVRDVNPARGDFSASPVIANFTSLGPRAVFTLSRPLEESLRSIELWTTDGTDAGTERLLALPDDTGIRLLASNGRIAFFAVVRSPFLNPESSLWRTDGTEAGTFLLASGLGVFPQPAAFLGGSAVFSGCTPDLQRCEPWTSDGTVDGTRRLRDITPGEFGSNPREFVAAGGFVYFFADAPDGVGLWRTDATPQGTRQAALLPTFSRPRNLIAAGARLYFMMGPDFVPGGGPRASLWTSDGTPSGTRAVPPFDRGRTAVAQWIGTLGQALIFIGVDPAAGWQVYRTDGTPGGTRRLTSFSGEPFGTSRGATLGNRLVFQGPGRRLWTTAGTRASTRALAPLALDTEFGQPVFFVTRGRAVFAGSTLGEEKDVEPWVTDGTPAGTFKLADLCPGECSTFLVFGATLLGQVQFYSNGNLWGTDGTPEGTRLLAQGAIPPENQLPAPIAAARRRLVFAGFDADAPPGEFTLELKVTNGTPEGTRTLDLPLFNGAGSNPKGFTPLGDDVFFFACSPLGFEWRTDGTPETTVPLGEGRVFCDDPTLPPPIVLDGIAYFLASGPREFWREVWRSDGTPEGTYPITHVGPAMDVTALTALNGELFFFTDEVNGDVSTAVSTLWRSNGTPTGTAPVYELDRRYYSSLTTVGDRMFYVAWLPDEPMMLYVSDGTEAGTRPLVNSREVTDFVQLGGQIFYLSENSIMKTDGTPEGTRPFIPPGLRVGVLADLAVYGGRLYFMGIDIFDLETNEGIPTLFQSDGTVAGTVRLKTFDKDDPNVFPQVPLPRFAEGAGALFFVAHDKAHGSELWKTDGTAAGTVLVRDVRPGPASSRIGTIAGAGDRVFFSADDGAHGVELWTSDGTPPGTRLVADVAEGPRSSFPRQITRIGNRVFFSADDGVVGREPWVLPLDSILLGRIIP